MDLKSNQTSRSTRTHWFASVLSWMDQRPVRACAVFSLALNFLLECLSQRSILLALVHTITQPFVFCVGAGIVFFTLSFALHFSKRYFLLVLIGLIWLGLGIGNFVMLGYRVTPLSAIDFALLPSVFSIIGIYLKVWQIVLICIAFVAAIALVVWLAIRVPKRPVSLRRTIPATLLSFACIFIFLALGQFSGTLPMRMSNLLEAYHDYGFAHCFTVSIFDRGIDKPDEYDAQISELAEDLDDPEAGEIVDETIVQQPEASRPIRPDYTPKEELFGMPDMTPVPEPMEPLGPQVNVIFLQLESFINPTEILKYSYSQTPCPTFERLLRTAPSGYLTVPSIGAGTANTEFEVISGMSLQFFGTGEYPYKTVLRDNTCETICYNLKENGYTTTAIHNNAANFYDRNQVFSHLGFDRFIGLEYMNDVRYNPQGWACDEVLTGEILKTLSTTKERDLIYTISVQGHGKYPDERPEDDTGTIEVEGALDEIEESRVTYFINQLAEMDQFLTDLTTELASFEEPVLLVMYGDHLPSLDLEEQDMRSEDLFRTQYVLWNNFGLVAKDRDLNAYQLGAYVMKLLGYNTGNLTRLHQSASDSREYLTQLELLEYDMLYGEQVVYDGKNPYRPTKLQMGVLEIRLQSVAIQDETLYIFGENFTPYSVACINGRQYETIFLDSNTLSVSNVQLENVRTVLVQQVSEDAEVLSETEPYSMK